MEAAQFPRIDIELQGPGQDSPDEFGAISRRADDQNTVSYPSLQVDLYSKRVILPQHAGPSLVVLPDDPRESLFCLQHVELIWVGQPFADNRVAPGPSRLEDSQLLEDESPFALLGIRLLEPSEQVVQVA